MVILAKNCDAAQGRTKMLIPSIVSLLYSPTGMQEIKS